MFSTTCVTTEPLTGPARVGDRHTKLARSPFVGGIPSRATGLPETMFATLRAGPAVHLDQSPYHPYPKATNISLDQISIPLLWNIWSVASYYFSLKPLTNSYNLQPRPLYRQHHSTQLIIKRHLTGPLFCHYFCYYLEQVFDNEMFTIGNTLNFSYGGLGEELSDLYYLKMIGLTAFCQVPSIRAQVWIALQHGIYSHLWWKNQQ